MGAAKPPETEKVTITRMLVARREFWYAVLAGIGAVVIVILATLWIYPELLSEIVHLWEEDEPAYVTPRLLEPYDYDPKLWPQIEATIDALRTAIPKGTP